MAQSPYQLQTKITVKFDGSKLDAVGPSFNFDSTRAGGVAKGSDGNIGHHVGTDETHRLTGVELFVRKKGLPFRPWEHTQPGDEFDVTFQQGDPAFGGKSITFQTCLCRGEAQQVDNGQGIVKVTIPEIVALFRIDR